MSKLILGFVPAFTECPFRTQCCIAQDGACVHRGTLEAMTKCQVAGDMVIDAYTMTVNLSRVWLWERERNDPKAYVHSAQKDQRPIRMMQ